MIHARIRKQYAGGRDSAAFTLDMEFRAARGISVLFGPSGSGKTLTLDSIAGFVRPDEGRIMLDDVLLFDAAAGVHLPPRARRCGYVFQNYALFPHMTLRQNLDFAAEGSPRLERHRRVNEMLERFRLTSIAGRRPHEVSGGQKQRCSIARALIIAPRLLLLDEPAQGLDAPLRAELYEVLREVRGSFSTPVLLVSHNLEECFELGEEMFVLRDGRLVQSGPPAQVAAQPATIDVARMLGLFNLLPVEIRALDPSRNTSLLRYGEFDLRGPYFPHRLIGDRVTLFVPPARLQALPRDGAPGANQVPVVLDRMVEMPHAVRMEFAGGISVEMPRPPAETAKQGAADAARHGKEWVVQFPESALRVL